MLLVNPPGVVNEDCWLLLNDRQRYTITIESRQPVSTFCPFFERGFVEDVNRARLSSSQELLDSPQPGRAAEFYADGGLPAGAARAGFLAFISRWADRPEGYGSGGLSLSVYFHRTFTGAPREFSKIQDAEGCLDLRRSVP